MPTLTFSLPMADFEKLRALSGKNKNTISGEVNRILRAYLGTLDANLEEMGSEKELELQSQLRTLTGKLEAIQTEQQRILSIYNRRQNALLERIEQLDPDFDRLRFIREAK